VWAGYRISKHVLAGGLPASITCPDAHARLHNCPAIAGALAVKLK